MGPAPGAVLARCDRAGAQADTSVCFLAEVYWDLEATLLAQGFDYAFDKRLYDLLRDGDARRLREHLRANGDQRRLARFIENHDEPRAAATFAPGMHEAAALVAFLVPGLRFFHQGQLGAAAAEGRRTWRVPPTSPSTKGCSVSTTRCSRCSASRLFRDGNFALRDCVPAWDGNGSSDAFIAWTCDDPGCGRRLIAVNYAQHRSQCYVRFVDSAFDGVVRLRDLMGPARYERDGRELSERGLYLDLPEWGCHVFVIE